MAAEIRAFSCLIPAGTPITAPIVFPLAMPARIVREIDMRIPPGPRGLVGFALGSAGQNIIPYNNGQWIIADDDTINWPLEDYLDSGAWQLQGYNLGQYDHTIYLRFLLDLVQRSTAAPTLTLISSNELSA